MKIYFAGVARVSQVDMIREIREKRKMDTNIMVSYYSLGDKSELRIRSMEKIINDLEKNSKKE